MRDRFPDGIRIYDEVDLNLLREYANETYGDIGISSKNRAFGVRLSEYLVLRGRGVYTAEENIYIEPALLDELKEYIDNRPEAEIYYADLFAKNEGRIRMMSSIDNYNYLHGVLKLYFSDEYDFYNRDYLSKRGKGLVSGRLSDRLRLFINQMGKPVHKKDIRREFPGLTDIVLTNAVLGDSSIFMWEYNVYTTLEIVDLTRDDISNIRNAILDLIESTDGYCSENMLYSEINARNPTIIRKNHMNNSNNMFYLCAKLFSDSFDFRKPHICRAGLMEEMSAKNVALHLMGYPEEITYAEFNAISKKLQWSHVTAGFVFFDIEKDYFRVENDLYIINHRVNITENQVRLIGECLLRKMDKGYLSLNLLEYDDFPNIEYEWNCHLMRSIIEKYISFLKIVEPKAKDRRYERGIAVYTDSHVSDYVDLVIALMRKNGISELSENKMNALLVVDGLAYKMIPKDLYVSDKIIFKNEQFILK